MLSHLSATLAVAYVLVFVVMQSSAASPDHLVVLSHGLHGGRHDLTYLAKGLEEKGCIVLRSSASEFLESHKGVREGGTRLAMEVLEAREQFPSLSKVSFVGNSLGGLYCRYAIKELYDKESGRIGDLKPQYFMVSLL
jgi:predicted alpha/beta-fold hydrolase